MKNQFIDFPISSIPVAQHSMPCLSPLQYPGAKTWLMPHIRKWLITTRSETLIEPFAGGAVVSLTALQERLVQHAIMIELDEDMIAFWRTVLEDPEWMIKKIFQIEPDREQIKKLVNSDTDCLKNHGFHTLLKNYLTFNGMLHGRIQNKTFHIKWRPNTWRKRLMGVKRIAHQITFHGDDCLQLLPKLLREHKNAAVFVDPPYSAAGGNQAAEELYRYFIVDHAKIFEILANSKANFLMTYDTADEIVDLVQQYGFNAVRVRMKNNLHKWRYELIITRDPMFNNIDMNEISLF